MEQSKILLIKLRALGDTVLLTAAIESLRKARPHAQIHVLIPKAWAPVLENNPHIAKIWPWASTQTTAKWGTIMRIVPKLRKEHFDICVNFHSSPSSAWISRLSGARIRSNHFHGHKEPNRFSTVTIPGKGELKPILERDLDALRGVIAHEPLGLSSTRVYLTAEEIKTAKDWVTSQGLKKPLLTLGVGASRPTKIWPMDHFAELALAWTRKTGGSVLAVGSPGESGLMSAFNKSIEQSKATKAERAQILTRADWQIRELASVIHVSDVFVGNDSGPKHLAVAVHTPTVTLFGPENPFEWHPYNQTEHPVHFVDGLECRTNISPNGTRWCGIEECIKEKHKCMTQLKPSEVLESCLRVSF